MRWSRVPILIVAALCAAAGHAQNWTVFVPQERDFRVVFPAEVTRLNQTDGSVAFRSAFEEVEYTVYRLPANTAPITDPGGELQRRLATRVSDDVHIRRVRDDEDGDWPRHVFEFRRSVSIHRLVEYRGRYYELQVRGSHDQRTLARHTARDFFNSFHLQGIPLPAIGGTLVQRLEAWCQSRTNRFARAFCEYSVCVQPGYEQYPHCNALLMR